MKSKLLLTVDHQFVRTPDGSVWVKTIYGYEFWKRYLNVFDAICVVARVQEVLKEEEKMLLSSGEHVEFYDLPQYRGPKEFVSKYMKIRKRVKGIANSCSCAIFRIPSPIANLVKKEVIKNKLPWAVEIVNDPWDNFAPGTYKSLFRPIYRMHFVRQVKEYAKKANGASYVTEFALQRRYPSYVKLYGDDIKHFESYYSSILLRKEFFSGYRKAVRDTGKVHLIHVNSCITDMSKGHDVVIKIVKILRNLGYDADVTFVGDGPMRYYYEKMAEDNGIQRYVKFTGILSSGLEVREELMKADILVFPTLGEGLPRTVIEAMAVGLPCLSTPVNGIPELLLKEDMFEQQDVGAFAKRIIEIISNSDLYQSESMRNINKAMEYENKILQKRRDEFYQKLLELSL